MDNNALKFCKQQYSEKGHGIVSICVVHLASGNIPDGQLTRVLAKEIERDFPDLDTGLHTEVDIRPGGEVALTFSAYTTRVPNSYERLPGMPELMNGEPPLTVPKMERPETL